MPAVYRPFRLSWMGILPQSRFFSKVTQRTRSPRRRPLSASRAAPMCCSSSCTKPNPSQRPVIMSVARSTDLTSPNSENNLFKLSTVVREDKFCTIIFVIIILLASAVSLFARCVFSDTETSWSPSETFSLLCVIRATAHPVYTGMTDVRSGQKPFNPGILQVPFSRAYQVTNST